MVATSTTASIVWYRMLSPLLGGSVFTFGLILAVALAGIGIGGLLYALIADERRPSPSGLAFSCLLQAAAIVIPYAIGDRLALMALMVGVLRGAGFLVHVLGWTAITIMVVLLPAVIAGYQFPFLIGLLGRGRERVGRHVGLVYGVNTVGAIAGSLAGGFGLLPLLSAPGAWLLVSVLLLLLGGTVAALSDARSSWPVRLTQLALAGVTMLLLFATGPTAAWRHSGIASGRVSPNAIGSANQMRDWAHARRSVIEWEADGTESSVALARDITGYSFIVNGKSDGSAQGDAATQVMLGLLGTLLHPDAKRSLVIGLGTGSTAGWLAAVPRMEKVDVVELEPLVLEIARARAAT